MSDVTSINPSLNNSNSTVVNNEVLGNNVTAVNAELLAGTAINVGDTLCDKYKVDGKLGVSTGEADLYLCSHEDKKYIAKVYRRQLAVKGEIIDKLKSIDSPNIAKVYATGEKNGFPIVVIPYYMNGSLQGKKYNYNVLKEKIIPSLNEGLKMLHENGIIHKDLKPSNIMINDDGAGVSIIDFGISSVHDSDNTVIVTQTGMTPQYSAPETFNNVYIDESDYFSFGITLYELFCGNTPYSGMETDDILRYSSVQKIPFPS
jgi:serine/threonine protein kinase